MFVRQDWPQIQFIDDRDGCLLTSCVERIKVQKSAEEKGIKMQNSAINASLSSLQQQILGVLSHDPKASYEVTIRSLF